MPRKIDQYIDALYKALTPDGADSYETIRKRMARILGCRFSLFQTNCTISYERRHAAIYGWIVPYVKRGTGSVGEEHRFFALDIERDPDFAFDAEYRANFDNGCYDTVASVERFCANLSVMIETAKQYEPLRPRKEYLDDFKEVMDFFSRRAARLRRKVDDQRDDHAA
jgi:hypothetical protein